MAKFCGKCGAQLDDNAVVCGQCGNPVPHSGKANSSNKFKLDKKKKIIIAATAIIAILTVSLICILSVLPKTINLEKYVTVEFSGADGYGKAIASVDWDRIQSDYASKVKKTDQASFYFSEYGRYTLSDAISEAVVVTLSKDNRLSNGETVVLQWEQDAYEYLSAFNVKLSYNDIEYTVEGLCELTTFDAFSSISVTFDALYTSSPICRV